MKKYQAPGTMEIRQTWNAEQYLSTPGRVVESVRYTVEYNREKKQRGKKTEEEKRLAAASERARRGLVLAAAAGCPWFWETCPASLLGVPNSSLIYDWHSLPFFEGAGWGLGPTGSS